MRASRQSGILLQTSSEWNGGWKERLRGYMNFDKGENTRRTVLTCKGREGSEGGAWRESSVRKKKRTERRRVAESRKK